MGFQENILDLIAVKKPCIQIRTSLEKEVLPSLLNILYENGTDNIYKITELDKVEKLTINNKGAILKAPVEDPEFGLVQFNPMTLLHWTRRILQDENSTETNAFIFIDYDNTFDRPTFRRWIKDIFEFRQESYIPFIFISSEPNIPDDMNHLFSVVYYDNPTIDEIKQLLSDYKAVRQVEIKNINKTAHKFLGFNRTEIIECLDYCFYKFNGINDAYLKTKKIEVIKKSNVLDYKEPVLTLDDLAGNKEFKRWYEESKFAFDPEARKYNVPLPKGFLGLSIPGCGKQHIEL